MIEPIWAIFRESAERLGGRKDEARATLRAAALESPKGRWLPKIQFELAGLELAAGNLAVAEELARSEASPTPLPTPKGPPGGGLSLPLPASLIEPDDPVVRPDPNAAWDLLVPGARPGQEPRASCPASLRDGANQPASGQLPPGDRAFPGLSERVSPGGRPLGRAVSPGRSPAPGRSVAAGAIDLD